MPDEKQSWRIFMQRQPAKVLRRLPRPLLDRIRNVILELADNPHPPGSKKLVGYNDLHRIRVGDWRVVYKIQDEQLLILVVRVAPRGSTYRKLQ